MVFNLFPSLFLCPQAGRVAWSHRTRDFYDFLVLFFYTGKEEDEVAFRSTLGPERNSVLMETPEVPATVPSDTLVPEETRGILRDVSDTWKRMSCTAVLLSPKAYVAKSHERRELVKDDLVFGNRKLCPRTPSW